jgi:hypothetical protein
MQTAFILVVRRIWCLNKAKIQEQLRKCHVWTSTSVQLSGKDARVHEQCFHVSADASVLHLMAFNSTDEECKMAEKTKK